MKIDKVKFKESNGDKEQNLINLTYYARNNYNYIISPNTKRPILSDCCILNPTFAYVGYLSSPYNYHIYENAGLYEERDNGKLAFGICRDQSSVVRDGEAIVFTTDYMFSTNWYGCYCIFYSSTTNNEVTYRKPNYGVDSITKNEQWLTVESIIKDKYSVRYIIKKLQNYKLEKSRLEGLS